MSEEVEAPGRSMSEQKEGEAAPAEIWLQVDQESPDIDDSTWCRDKINDSDVRYVRADLSPAAQKEGEAGTDGVKGLDDA